MLRIVFAVLATLLLRLPLLQAAGGLLLLVIAARLLAGRGAHASVGTVDAAQPAARSRRRVGDDYARRLYAAVLLMVLFADVALRLRARREGANTICTSAATRPAKRMRCPMFSELINSLIDALAPLYNQWGYLIVSLWACSARTPHCSASCCRS